MVSTISINPILTSVASGSFNATSAGLIQGTAYDSPNSRYNLSGGILASTETLPMWGGVGISNAVPGASGQPASQLGTIVTRATTITSATSGQLTGFSVFDQNHAMINSPESPVPLAASYMMVNYYLLGSGARIAVACDPNLVDLQSGVITQNVSWDFVNQLLIPYSGSVNVSSGTYNSTTGLVTLTLATSPALLPGDTAIVAGITGTGSFASCNGTFVCAAGTTTTTLNYYIATGLTLTISTTGTVTTGGILPIKGVLDVNVGNCMTVTYNSGTGYATWNRNGTCAVILL